MKRWMLMSALALALAACSDEETKPSGEPSNPTCTVDETAVCEGKCGTITVKDSCDADVSVDCGDTCGDTESCNAETNTCEADAPTCTVDETAACEGKCGTITVKDSCDADVSIECGDNCGDGMSCSAETNTCEKVSSNTPCMTSFDCSDPTEYCAYTTEIAPDGTEETAGFCTIGARGTKQCGETIAANEDATVCESGLLDANDATTCACPCMTNDWCGDKYFCNYDLWSSYGWYAECELGERGTKQCGEPVTESSNECDFGFAVEGEIDGNNYCSCSCETDADCPEALSYCSHSGGNVCIYKLN